jgi:hypothetical protein
MNELDKRLRSVALDKSGIFKNDRIDSAPVWPDSWSMAVSAQEMFELMLLANLGQQIGSISAEAVSDLRREVFHPFLIAMVRSRRLPRATPESPYSFEAAELRRAFRPFVEIIDGAYENEFNLGSALKIERPASFERSFEKILLIAIRMLQDEGIRLYLTVVKYASNTQWRAMFEQDIRPEDVARAGESGDLTAAVVLYGFLRSLGYRADLQSVLNSTHDLESSSDVTRFTERVRDIFNWRIDFLSKESSDRFEALRKYVVTKVIGEIPAHQRYKLQESLDQIFDEVLGLQSA